MRIRLIGFVFASIATSVTLAQQAPQNVLPQPRINSVMPMGGQVGQSIVLTVFGTDLDEPTGLLFSHPGFQAELVLPPEPKPDPNKKDPPKPMPAKPKAIPLSHKYTVMIPAEAPIGMHDVRIVTKLGVSNPRAFLVGEWPEVLESDKPHGDVAEAQTLQMNSVVNGTIANPADVDYYGFAVKAGQRVILNVRTSSIDSRCRPLLEVFDPSGKRLGSNRNDRDSDALFDFTAKTDGRYLARICEFAYQSGSAEHFYRFTVSTGPWIDAVYPCVVSPTAPTAVTVYGRNLPGGKVAEGMTSLDGRPLETSSVTITPPSDAARDQMRMRERTAPTQALGDGFEFRLKGSNAVPLYFGEAKVHLEGLKPNDSIETAEAIAVPCDVLGRIEKRYDKDWFKFAAKKGEVFIIELFADRIGSEMDTYYLVKAVGSKGNVIEEQDDDPESLHPQTFFTRSGDPAASKFTAPADGEYAVLVASREANVNFGPRCQYRLRIAKPAPNFRAVAMPKSRDYNGPSHLYAGGECALDVFLDRRDGFTGPVAITATGLPPGVTAKPAIIGTNNRWGTLVLSAAENVGVFTGPIVVSVSGTIGEKLVSHTARPASITWSVQPQQNIPTITRLDAQLMLAVRTEKSPLRIAFDLPTAKVKTKDKEGKDSDVPLVTPLFVIPGDKLTLPVKILWQGEGARPGPVNLRMERIQANNQTAAVATPQGDDNTPAVVIAKEKNDGAILIDVRPNAVPGVYSINIRGDTTVSFARDPGMKDKKSNVVVQAFADPLEVTVLPIALGKFTAVPPANNQLKAGSTAELTIKVERLFDYVGEFAVKVVVPPEVKGLMVKDAKIAAGSDEVKIPIEIAKEAKDAGNIELNISATATVHGKFAIGHKLKVSGLKIAPEKK